MTTEARHARNVSIEGEQVAVTLPFDYFGGCIAIAAYVGVVALLVEAGFPHRLFTAGHIGFFLIVTLIWAWYMSRRRVVTTFDGRERRVTRRNLFGMEKTFDFADIGGVMSIDNSGGGSYYSLKLANDVHGKGYLLTRTMNEASPERAFFQASVLPKIQEMLAAGKQGASSVAPGRADAGSASRGISGARYALPEQTRFFRRRGMVYTRSKALGSAIVMLLGAALIVAGFVALLGKGDSGVTGALVMLGLGLLFLWFGVNRIFKIELDAGEKKIHLCNWLGYRRKRSRDFADFSGFSTTRNYTNGIYTGTEMELCFSDGTVEPGLVHVFMTKKLTGLSDEIENIIYGALYPDGLPGTPGGESAREGDGGDAGESQD